MFRNGQVSQKQLYTLQHESKTLTIRESATLEGKKGIEINCLFSITPIGYSKISISIVRDDVISHELEFTCCNTNSSQMMVNGVSKDIELNEEILLLDGPNPMFDYANSIFLLGLQNMETCNRTVHVLDWSKGVFCPLEYEFSKKENSIFINKKGMGITVEMVLDPNTSFVKEASYSNGEHYVFERG
jgi:hypothetical protein